ncbi:MAG: hypothetical protein RIF36_19920 [Imperialibacter sp.]|uniref:hypothetical protein n=1 Tax=Imperialibacter sp. TaxID=2038411 RepID=UPI0032ED8AE2
MTEREIRKYIDRLNSEKADELIFTRPISKTVDVAKVWTEQPKMTDNIVGNFRSFRFFFIRDDSGQYIGAVLDMYQDLHWYVVPKSRKRGHLTTALKESILPYLFCDGRESQTITIEKDAIGEKNYLSSKGVAIKLGFEPRNEEETEFELKPTDLNWDNVNLEEDNVRISSERFEILRKRVFYAYKMLCKISDELLIKVDNDEGLREVADEVRNYTWRIDDIEWKSKRTKR